MKFKLDECVDARLSMNLKEEGYEAVTTRQQGLRGIEDEGLCHLCKREGYILVTLNIHFSNPLYPRDFGAERARRFICHNPQIG
jgi:predicted nuclease of predicted toxin-antitoxin system